MAEPATVVNGQVVDDLTIANTKTQAGMPAAWANMLMGDAVANTRISNQNATAHQQAMQSIQVSNINEAQGGRAGLDVMESQAVRGVVGSDLAKTVADLGAVVQGFAKILQTTPPITAPGPATGDL